MMVGVEEADDDSESREGGGVGARSRAIHRKLEGFVKREGPRAAGDKRWVVIMQLGGSSENTQKPRVGFGQRAA
jgi:hypothetical protein